MLADKALDFDAGGSEFLDACNRVLIIGYKNEESGFPLGLASGPVRMGFGLSYPLEFPPPTDSAHEAGSWELDVGPIAIGGSVLKSRLA